MSSDPRGHPCPRTVGDPRGRARVQVLPVSRGGRRPRAPSPRGSARGAAAAQPGGQTLGGGGGVPSAVGRGPEGRAARPRVPHAEGTLLAGAPASRPRRGTHSGDRDRLAWSRGPRKHVGAPQGRAGPAPRPAPRLSEDSARPRPGGLPFKPRAPEAVARRRRDRKWSGRRAAAAAAGGRLGSCLARPGGPPCRGAAQARAGPARPRGCPWGAGGRAGDGGRPWTPLRRRCRR